MVTENLKNGTMTKQSMPSTFDISSQTLHYHHTNSLSKKQGPPMEKRLEDCSRSVGTLNLHYSPSKTLEEEPQRLRRAT